MEEISWIIETFETNSGEKVVDKFIKKQTQETPQKELGIALQRMKSLTSI